MKSLNEFKKALQESVKQAEKSREGWKKKEDWQRAAYCEGLVSGFNNALYLISIYLE